MTLGMTGTPPRSEADSWRIAVMSGECGSEDDAGKERSVSTLMASSPITLRSWEMKADGLSPGRSRQSSWALASAAKTFPFQGREGGEVALDSGDEVDRGLVAPDLVERADQTGHGGEAGRCGPVPCLSMCHQLEPAWSLLRHRHLHDLLPTAQVDVVPLGEQVLGVAEQVPTVVHEPPRPRAAPALL